MVRGELRQFRLLARRSDDQRCRSRPTSACASPAATSNRDGYCRQPARRRGFQLGRNRRGPRQPARRAVGQGHASTSSAITRRTRRPAPRSSRCSISPTDPVTGEVLGGLGIARRRGAGAGRRLRGRPDLGLDREVWGVTGLINAELSDNFTSTRSPPTALRRARDPRRRRHFAAGHHRRRGFDSKQFSQELRLTWDNDGPVTAFVGASYFHEKGRQRTPPSSTSASFWRGSPAP